jgi:PAS domain S-box-containing protein
MQKLQAMMSLQKLRLLMLEDNADDAYLIEKTLERAEFDLDIKVVSTKEQFVDAIDRFSPQVVLSDHQLHQFNSMEALYICRRSYPLVPFILVTGAVSDEFAASIIKAGADDYVLKENLRRLPTAIRGALERKNIQESLQNEAKLKQKAEHELRDFNERYEILSRATNDAIWDWDIVNDIEVWNHGIETIFGYTNRETHSSKQWWQENILPADYDRVNQEIAEAFRQKATNWSSKYQYRCSDGTYKHVFDRAYIIYHNDTPVRMIGAMQDISEQTRAIEEIERLSLVASKTNNSVIITDQDGKIVWVNDAFVRLTGYSQQEVAGKKPGHFLQGKESDPAIVERIRRRLRDLRPFTEEIINYSKNKRKFWLQMSISPVFDDCHRLKHFIAIGSDITQQKEFENNITSIARELSALIENANAPIFGTDRNGYINEWNKVTAVLTGYSKNEVLGKTLLQDFVRDEDRENFKNIFTRALQEEVVDNVEFPIVTRHSKPVVVLTSITLRKNASQEISGLLMVGQDITELIEYRSNLEAKVHARTYELNDALKKEKELVEMKSRFISIASHEFRTPLSTISLVAGVLRKHKEKLSAEEYNARLEKIEKQVRHMTYLLDDVLIIGKAEAGKIETHYAPIPVESFFRQTAREVELSKATHRLILKIDSQIEIFYSDEKLLRNIVINLFTNAIKFSPSQKSVNVVVVATQKKVVLEVEDRGIGIREEDMQKIFTSFHRGNNVGEIPGTGLGLSIVKKAVELLNGRIEVTSKPLHGTRFTVTLPSGPNPNPPEQPN